MPETVENHYQNHTADTNDYAGPFCSCGDYSCPASSDDHADCINSDHNAALDSWCPCSEPDCAAHNNRTATCSYPPEHPIHH